MGFIRTKASQKKPTTANYLVVINRKNEKVVDEFYRWCMTYAEAFRKKNELACPGDDVKIFRLNYEFKGSWRRV